MLKSQSQNEELKAIIASVFYLETEANRAGLQEIGFILKETLANIEKWLTETASGKGDGLSKFVDSDLYKILTLMNKFSKLYKTDLVAVLDAIESHNANGVTH
jgi:hypothetical protein